MQTTEQLLASKISTSIHALIVSLPTGDVSIPWEQCSQRLARATDEQRRNVELSPSGYGIHWPLIDEDLTVNGLARKAASPVSQ